MEVLDSAASFEVERAYKRKLVYTLFDQLFNADADSVTSPKPNPTLPTIKGDFEVFGWHPYWLSNSFYNYDYKQLTTLAYFSCTMALMENGNIEYLNNGWGNTPSNDLISLAHQDSCNVLLSLRCQEHEAIEHLLQNKGEQIYCIEHLVELTNGWQSIEGINVSFEEIPSGYRNEFTSFLRDLSNELLKHDKRLVLTLPAVPDQKKYDFNSLNAFIDQYVIMGFNYYYSGSTKPGPVAPYKSGKLWGELNLSNTLASYLRKGLKKEKLIMALPTYGATWEIDTLPSGYVKNTFKEHRRLNQILKDLNGEKPQYEEASQSAYYTFEENGKNYICYFDDVKTLAFKFNWIKSQNLRGIGLWALGYNDGRDDIWNLLAENYKITKNYNFKNNDSILIKKPTETALISGIETPDAIGGDFISIIQQKEVSTMIALIFVTFIIIGVIIAFFSVFRRFLITEWSVYFRAIGIFVLFILVSILIANFVLLNNEMTAEKVQMQIKSTALFSDYIIPALLYFGVLGCLFITALSWRLFLTLNSDLP